jgi:translation initiation factor IF-1
LPKRENKGRGKRPTPGSDEPWCNGQDTPISKREIEQEISQETRASKEKAIDKIIMKGRERCEREKRHKEEAEHHESGRCLPGEEHGVVVRKLDNGYFLVQCMNNKEMLCGTNIGFRKCYAPLIQKGDLVIVSLFYWQKEIIFRRRAIPRIVWYFTPIQADNMRKLSPSLDRFYKKTLEYEESEEYNHHQDSSQKHQPSST